jgi:hypothetical protein
LFPNSYLFICSTLRFTLFQEFILVYIYFFTCVQFSVQYLLQWYLSGYDYFSLNLSQKDIVFILSLFWKVFIPASILKDNFAGYSKLGCKLFWFRAEIYQSILLTFRVSAERFVVILIGLTLNNLASVLQLPVLFLCFILLAF